MKPKFSGSGCHAGIAALALAVVGFGPVEPAAGQAGVRRQVQRQLAPRRQAEAVPEPAAPSAQTAAESDLQKIDDAETIEELIDLGKLFVLSQKLDAAAECVEEIVAREPAMLEDGRRQSVRSWNEFWFTYRARMREAKLSPRDATGRVKIAVWLHDAGLGSEARAMLTKALAIDPDESSAKELAQKWHIYSGGPVRIDLACLLDEPLVVETIQDENQTISPLRRERVYLILPIVYNTAGLRLIINKFDLKVTGDDGRPCPTIGLKVLARTDTGVGTRDDLSAIRALPPHIRLPTGGEPIWERIIVEPAKDDLPEELVLTNTLHPIVRPAPGQRPAPAPRANAGPVQETRPSPGYAAFVVEIPATLKQVECVYKRESPVTLDIEFLKLLSVPIKDLQPVERDRMIRTLAGQATAPAAPVASAALRKLDAFRLSFLKDRQTSGADGQEPPLVGAIEQMQLAAFGHENPLVRRDAFELLSREPSTGLAARIAAQTDEAVLKNLMTEVSAYFVELREAIEAAEAKEELQMQGLAQAPPAREALEPGLPPLPGRQGVAAFLAGGFNCKLPAVQAEALKIILANPFRETVEVLASANDEAVRQLLTEVPKIEDAKAKEAVLRVLLSRSPNRLLGETLAAFADVRLTILQDDDPVLELALREHPPAVQRLLLELLARADLSAVQGSEKIKKLIEMLADTTTRRDPGVRAAMLKLAESHLKGGYTAPVKRGNAPGQRGGMRPGGGQGGGFGALLASVAAGADTDAQTAREAATALLNLGQVEALNEGLKRLQGPAQETRVLDLIQHLARDKSLWKREALPVFLAGQLAGSNERVLQLALSALNAIQKSVEPDQRWKVNLAIKQGVEARRLVALSVHLNERIARPALLLLRDLGGLTSAEAAELESLPDETGRQDRLNTFEQKRSGQPVGTFNCMIYVDVDVNPRARAATPREAPAGGERRSVPLPSIQVHLQKGAQGSQVRVVADGLQIGPVEAGGDRRPAPSPGSISVNAASLLRAALESPEARAEGLADKISPASLRAQRPCELKYEQLGAWSCELHIQDSPDASSAEYPLRLTGAKILLEPTTR